MISVFFADLKIVYEHATHVYEINGSFHISNADINHVGSPLPKIYAVIPSGTPCIIQNDDAVQSHINPKSSQSESK